MKFLFILFLGTSAIAVQAQQINSQPTEKELKPGIVFQEQCNNTIKMTRSGARLHKPRLQEEGQHLVYGLALPMQISPTEVALLVNVRNTGVPVIDFENGYDVIIFNSLDQINDQRALKGIRNVGAIHPRTGRELTMVHIVPTAGFVPLGAKLADGSPHPHEGTGFGLMPVRGYPADNSMTYPPAAEDLYQYLQLVQYSYDGEEFKITRMDKIDNPDELLPGWKVGHGALGPAIADGKDLLFGLVAQGSSSSKDNQEEQNVSGSSHGSGLSRWRFGPDGWRPVHFLPINDGEMDGSTEPTLIRDTDGSLLFSVRGGREKQLDFRLYRSTNNGDTWSRILHLPDRRAASPTSILQTVSGQPFIAANPYQGEETDSKGRPIKTYNLRDRLWFWPLKSSRRSIEAPYQALNADEVVGTPRDREVSDNDNIWLVDHPTGGLFRLGDGQWHSLITFRLSDSAVNIGGALPASDAGLWVEEIIEKEGLELQENVLPWHF